LKYLDEWTQARQRNAARYRDLFTEAGLSINIDSLPYWQADAEEAVIEGGAASPLASLDGVVLPVEAPGVRHIYNQFVIRSGRRDELISFLTKHQIGTEIYYPVPMHMQECFADLGYREGEFPQSERAAAETLALPIYPELTEEMLSNVVLTIAKFYEGSTEEE
jgi:dTDP-4-amino-4,6-dideoxygalactose transaminase